MPQIGLRRKDIYWLIYLPGVAGGGGEERINLALGIDEPGVVLATQIWFSSLLVITGSHPVQAPYETRFYMLQVQDEPSVFMEGLGLGSFMIGSLGLPPMPHHCRYVA